MCFFCFYLPPASLCSSTMHSIHVHQQRLNLSVPADIDPDTEAKQKQVDELNLQIKTLLEQMEALGEEGKVDESQALLKLVESMRSQKTTLEQVLFLLLLPLASFLTD